MLAEVFRDASLGLYYRFQTETGLLGIHCVPGKRANYNSIFAQQLPLVSACIALLQKGRNKKIIEFSLLLLEGMQQSGGKVFMFTARYRI